MSVVITNHNGRHLLQECLPSVAAASELSTEVIVVDNASSDGSLTWLRSTWPDVHTIALDANRGYAAACNAGAASARGRCVVFLNNDVTVRRGWSTALARCLDRWPDVVIAGGMTVFMDRPTVVNTAGIRVHRSLAGADVSGSDLSSIPATERDVAAVSGVNLAVRRSWFETTGGFEEDFFMYYEDLELCLRAWIEGWRVQLVPDSVVLHAAGATAGGRDRAYRHFHTSRNRLLSAAKLLEPAEIPVAWGLSLLSDVAAIGWHLAGGRFRLAGRIARGKAAGVAAAVRSLPGYPARRRPLRATRRRSTRQLRDMGVLESLGVSVREFRRLGAAPPR